MQTPRIAQKQDLEKLRILLNQTLRSKNTSDVMFDYPQVFCENNFENVFVVEENNKIISTGSLYPIEYAYNNSTLKVGIISSTATNLEYREQGLGKLILDTLLSKAESINCDLVVLWSDLFDHYKKFGIIPCGIENAIYIDLEPEILHRPNITISEFYNTHNTAWKDIIEIYNKEAGSKVIRKPEVFIKLLNLPETLYMVAYKNKVAVAYIVIGKGEDLYLHIHEWAGSIDGLCELLSYAMKKFEPNKLTIMSSYKNNELYEFLADLGAKIEERFLGLIKIINKSKFADTEENTFGIPNSEIKPKVDFYLRGLDSA